MKENRIFTKEKDSEKYQGELPIFVKWLDFLKWLLHVTEKFPKKARFIFSNRIDNLALDIVEDLVQARYSNHKISLLRTTNIRLEKIRILLRISYECRFLSYEAYQHSMDNLYEIGKMLGGWIKHKEKSH